MKRRSECFVGITSWNSESFLRPCLSQIKKTAARRVHVVVLDNHSSDRSAEVARTHGAEVVVRRCRQAEALNALLKMSRSPYTLLMHADVILLHPNWLDICKLQICNNIALLSPEDIGCGPYTRPWGKGMPESSFMFFQTNMAMAARRIFWRQRFKVKWPYRALDFNGDHVTYNIPKALATQGFSWRMMDVHASPEERRPVYTPNFKPKFWGKRFAFRRYGLGNFYSVNGEITHYHNWYDRVGLGSDKFDPCSTEMVPQDGGIPKAYLKICSGRFLRDLENNCLKLPKPKTLGVP